jgi:hypothetical protein
MQTPDDISANARRWAGPIGLACVAISIVLACGLHLGGAALVELAERLGVPYHFLGFQVAATALAIAGTLLGIVGWSTRAGKIAACIGGLAVLVIAGFAALAVIVFSAHG